MSEDQDMQIAMRKVKRAIWSQVPGADGNELHPSNNSVYYGKPVLSHGLAIGRALDEGRDEDAAAMMAEYGIVQMPDDGCDRNYKMRLMIPNRVAVFPVRRRA